MADIESVACVHDAMDCDVYSCCESANSGKSDTLEKEAHVLEIYISPEVQALLTAAEASAARGADALDGMGLLMSGPVFIWPSTTPPKRYYKTMWRSFSLRILDHSTHTARG